MGKARFAALCVALGFFRGPVFGQPAISAIVNAGSGSAGASPGCMETIYGSDLAPLAADASAGNLPTTLNGVTVTVGGTPAPLKYVSPGQINFQVPFEVTDSTAPVVVTNGTGSTPFTLRLTPVSPGLISVDPRHALIIGPDFRVKSTLRSGDIIVLYAVGLGPTSPPTATGAAGTSQEPLNRVLDPPTLLIGGRQAQILFAGMAPGFPGVYQINATVPARPLNNILALQSGGFSSSNSVSFASNNVSRVSGLVELLYPLPTSMVTFSPVPVISRYAASFDIAPDAQPFLLVAQASAGSSVITVDPQAGKLLGTATVPTAAERYFNFSQSGLSAFDFLTNTKFPESIVPASRIDPASNQALQYIPAANSGTSGAIGTYTFSDTVKPGSSFMIDASYPTAFGAYSSYSGVPASHTVSADLTLFVDGILVDSKSVTAPTP